MVDILGELLSAKSATVLIEYPPSGHPERVFADIIKGYAAMGVKPLVVDIWDTLHVFVQNLRFSGIEVDLEGVPVIKEKGAVNVGNVLGRVDVLDDFEYHLAVYSRVAKSIPEESRSYTIVLGLEKFPFTFLDDPPKLERYFETITRRYLPVFNKVSLLFLNTGVASRYLIKELEQESDYVLLVKRGGIELMKSPGDVP